MPPRRFVRKFTLAVWIFGIAAISILGTGQAYAQVAGATLTGTVKDSSSGIILYTAPNLLPGTYEVRVTAAGFSAQLPGVSNLDFSLI